MSVSEHKISDRMIQCVIITVSDTRNADTDKSGKLMEQALLEADFSVSYKTIVLDDLASIHGAVVNACRQSEVDAVLINGGTGIAARDVTIEIIQPMLDKEMPGFGEIFRKLSYEEDIGSAAVLSRAIAGVRGDTAIFSVPGSSGAVRLAMNRLILPELAHVVNEVQKDINVNEARKDVNRD